MARRAALRPRLLAAGATAGLFVAGFALAGGTGAALEDSTSSGVTLTDITTVTTDVTTNLPTTVLTGTQAVKPKPPPRKRRPKRTTTASTAATTAAPPATTAQRTRTTARARHRASTIAAAATGSSGLPGWAIAGLALAAALIAAGLGGLYVTRR